MRSPPCLLLLFQALSPGLAVSLHKQLKHQETLEDQLFLDDSTAHRFLGRKPLYNHWDFELITPGNLQRECIEEVCSYEEAREVFEDDFLTAEKCFGRATNTTGKEAQAPESCLYKLACCAGGVMGNKAKATFAQQTHSSLSRPTRIEGHIPARQKALEDVKQGWKGTPGVDVAGLVAGLVAALVAAVMFVIVAMYCVKYRSKQRSRSRAQSNLYPEVPLTNFDEEPKPESAPGLPSYEQVLESSGVHDAPPPPYHRNSTNTAPPT